MSDQIVNSGGSIYGFSYMGRTAEIKLREEAAILFPDEIDRDSYILRKIYASMKPVTIASPQENQ